MTTAFHDLSAADNCARKLLSQMTLEEKLGQLSQFSGDQILTGPDGAHVDKSVLAAKGLLGSALNVRGSKDTNEMQRQAIENSRLKIPILFGMDIIHGLRTVYPIPLGLSCSWDAALVEECAHMAAVEAREEGLRWTFSPMVDIGRDARWGRVTEGSGEDSYLGSILAAAWVKGYQGDDLADTQSILACAKHFVGYGAVEGGREYDQVDLSERALREVHLPPFQAAVDAGVGTLMSAFNTLQGVPASANKWTLSDILRDEWNFEGFVVSDWDSIGEIAMHGVAANRTEAALKAITAGVDMDMQSDLYGKVLAHLVESGRLSVDIVDKAVQRVLRIKYALGLFENPYTPETDRSKLVMTSKHQEVARRAAEESFVLLKNEVVGDVPVLPLTAENSFALIGSLADSKEDMYGAWAIGTDAVTLRQALVEKLGDRLTYASFESESDSEAAISAAHQSDVIIAALGERGNMSGEANSRSSIELPRYQRDLLEDLSKLGKPIVLVLFSGRPLALSWEAANIPAILEVWFPGAQAGQAITNILFGDASPTGRLTMSFPRSTGQLPIYYNTFNTGRPTNGKKPGDGFLTGYVDEYNTALFPFGWGLTYSEFIYSKTEIIAKAISVDELNNSGSLTVRCEVKNVGKRDCAEIVQLYIRLRGTSVARPVRELKGFQRIEFLAGETRKVEFALTSKELAFWNIDMQQIVEPCELTVWIAPNSTAGESSSVIIE